MEGIRREIRRIAAGHEQTRRERSTRPVRGARILDRLQGRVILRYEWLSLKSSSRYRDRATRGSPNRTGATFDTTCARCVRRVIVATIVTLFILSVLSVFSLPFVSSSVNNFPSKEENDTRVPSDDYYNIVARRTKIGSSFPVSLIKRECQAKFI